MVPLGTALHSADAESATSQLQKCCYGTGLTTAERVHAVDAHVNVSTGGDSARMH